ncbi:MAG: NAD-dependent epimerase/dehydratase family protein [Eggerthellaceae bacterium]|nr:NAD-dependent epimerase/dehydratase family protein [Eggerthellaceae bacterium]
MHQIIVEDIEELISRDGLDLSLFKNSTVLVTGGNSLIGKYLVWLFCYLNDSCNFNIALYVLVRNLEKAQATFEEYVHKDYFAFLHQDICEPIRHGGGEGEGGGATLATAPGTALGTALGTAPEKIDYIFHLAASASARLISQDPASIVRANALGTINVLDFARRAGAKNVVFASTREIYGKLPEGITRIKETDMGILDPTHPRNSYPESKRLAEALFVAFEKQYGVPFTILRIAHTYGPGMEIENDGRIMADILGAVVRGENIVLNSDGSARRGFCYITDCIDGIVRAMFSEVNSRVFNLANETEPYPISEVSRMVLDSFPAYGLELKLAPAQEDAFRGGYNSIPLVQLDTVRLESLGWKPLVGLLDGMKRTVLSFK